MRGSPAHLRALCCRSGIIPAHAGLTKTAEALEKVFGDHPRACGAHDDDEEEDNDIEGSSPRMRGSQWISRRAYGLCGIIPAHAGLTFRISGTTREAWDHPRACGAHASATRAGAFLLGSSPRMRGSPIQQQRGVRIQGIIPAHAGLTRSISTMMSPRRDHPRACGAHFMLAPLARLWPGSSPRMRGSLARVSKITNSTGIIPAHAGLTLRP